MSRATIALFILNGAMIQDFKVALRRFVQAPGFTASAVIVLALGIGVNAAVFDLVHTLLFAAPAFAAPSELVQVFSQDKNNQQSYRALSYPTYRDIREQHGVFTDVAAFDLALIGLGQKGDTRRTMASTVSSNYFSVLGVALARGRSFTPEEEAPGRSASVAIVSYAYWQRHDLDPAVLGSQVLIQGHPFTIVGIAPQGFTGTTPVMFSVEVWTPLSVYDQMTNDSEPDGRNLLADRAGQQLKIIGRLKPGMTVAGARPELAGLASNLEKAFPVEQKDQTFTAGPLARFSVSPRPANEAGLRRIGLLLLGMSALVLLVACLNLANMLLARGMARRKEIAIRLAIGGSRLQIVRQLLIEGFVLALAGGAAGLTLGMWSARLIIMSADRMSPLFGIVWARVPSIQVLLATLGFCVAATLGFALGPALKLSRSPAGRIPPFAHGYQSDIFYFVRFRPRARGTDTGAADMIRRPSGAWIPRCLFFPSRHSTNISLAVSRSGSFAPPPRCSLRSADWPRVLPWSGCPVPSLHGRAANPGDRHPHGPWCPTPRHIENVRGGKLADHWRRDRTGVVACSRARERVERIAL